MDKKSQTTSILLLFLDRISPFLIVLLFGVIFGFFFFKVIQPEYQKYLPGGPLHADTEKVHLLDRTRYRNELQKLYSLYKENAGGDIDQLALMIPPTQDIPTIFASCEAIAKEQGVNLQSIEIIGAENEKTTMQGGIRSFTVSLQVQQIDYTRFKKFLSALESQMRLTDIQSVNFDPSGKAASFTMKVYWSPGKKK